MICFYIDVRIYEEQMPSLGNFPNFNLFNVNFLKGRKIMAFKANHVYKINIDTMDDAKSIVAIAGKLGGKIVLRSGSKFSVNAKSLLGVLLAKKLNWNDLKIEMEEDHYKEFEKYIILESVLPNNED